MPDAEIGAVDGVGAVDPFDLPEWLGVAEVTWTAESILGGHRVAGRLSGDDGVLACDVLACDLAHPGPVLDERWRGAAHHAWSLGEVLLLEVQGRLTLAVPGWAVTVEPALEAVRRLARAVGASTSRYAVSLRL